MNIDTGAEQRVTTTQGFDGLPAFCGWAEADVDVQAGAGSDGTGVLADFTLPSGY